MAAECEVCQKSFQRIGVAQHLQIDHSVVVEQATQRADQFPQIRLRKRVAKAIGENEQSSAVSNKAKDVSNGFG